MKHKKIIKWKNLKLSKNIYTCPDQALFRFISHLKFKIKKKKILDIGFLHGANLIEFKKRDGDVYGVDINKYFVKKFKKIFSKGKIKEVDISKNNINFNVKFDLIYCKDVIYYLSDSEIDFFLKNIKKNLKNKGIFILQFIVQDFKKSRKKVNIEDIYTLRNYVNSKLFEEENPVRFIKLNEMKLIIKKNNFKIMGSKTVIESFGVNEEGLRMTKYLTLKK